jgi:hypothetical protein
LADAARKKDGIKTPAQLPKADTESTVMPNKEGGYAPNYTPVAADKYFCPMGKELPYRETKKYDSSQGQRVLRIYGCGDCGSCPGCVAPTT